jgi:diguanylate cyclase (GGDEF)-like protein
LATRPGLSLMMIVLCLVCVGAGFYVERSVRQLEENHQVFRDRQLRNGFVSMSDIQRVLLIAHEASVRGAFTPETGRAFVGAVDMLFVRKENFRRVLRAGDTLASAEQAIRALESVVAIAEASIASDHADIDGLWTDLLAASEDARRKLVLFLDDMDRMQHMVLLNQSAAVKEQRLVVLVSLGGLTFVGIAGLLLLRREVIARRARERAEKDVEFLAYFDPLTKLPNRTQFQSRLGERLATSEAVALVLVDLDDFKAINDTYGHGAGDTVLQHVAGMLSARAARVGGFAARIGGDEFAMVMPTDDMGGLIAICQELLREARHPLEVEGESIRIGFSIGLATNTQLGQNLVPTVDSLCRVTDFALYAAKSNGRGQLTLYDQSLERRFLERRSMVDALPRAIADNHLDIYLQPKVVLPSRATYGFEALVRWHRDGRTIPPDEFITVAEESGLIFEIDRYVLQTAARIVSEFNRVHETAYSVSVNLSALHFASHRIITWVREALESSGLAPDLLTLEITETAEMRDWRQAQDVISRIRQLGTKIAIDDFGTGYSSLGYLRSTIADEIKIDRSMVQHIETSEKARFLLDGVLDMAHNLELEVVIEGVETAAQAETIHAMGANAAQGYLFGRPLPAEQALNALSDMTHDPLAPEDARPYVNRTKRSG